MKSWMSKHSLFLNYLPSKIQPIHQRFFSYEVIVNVRNHVVSNAKGTVCLSNVQKHFYNSERCNKIKTNILSTASITCHNFSRSYRHHPRSSNQYSMKSEEIRSQSMTRVVSILEVKLTSQSLPKRNPLK